MCKLCNTDRSIIKTIRKTTIGNRKKIVDTIYDYLGEYACKGCINSIKISYDSSNISLDKAILQKLYNSHRTFTSKDLGSIKNITKMVRRYILGCRVTIYTTAIGDVTISYIAVLRNTERKYLHGKARNTLEEAIQDKVELIRKYKSKKSLDLYIKSIEKYNQKLKESQNEQ